jgi:hypothetical protein
VEDGESGEDLNGGRGVASRRSARCGADGGGAHGGEVDEASAWRRLARCRGGGGTHGGAVDEVPAWRRSAWCRDKHR